MKVSVRDGQSAGTVFDREVDTVRLGRAESNDVVLPEWHVSGEHALITQGLDGVVVRDLGSTNGTRVERGDVVIDVREQSQHECVLVAGDVIALGDREQPVRVVVENVDGAEDARVVAVRRVSELPRVEAEVGADREVLRALYAAQKAIGAAIELDQVLGAVAEQVFRFLTRATHVTVALREEEEDAPARATPRYVPIGTRVRGAASRSDAVPITRSVFKKVVQERAAVLAADARRDVGETASIMGAQILSTMGVPLWQGDAILGVLQVDNRASSGLFRDGDLDILALLAQSASQAFAHAAVVHRLRVTEERQRKENSYLKRREEQRRFDGIVGDSRSMRTLFDALRKVVDTRVTVLIEGETGTGKELVASAVHYWSARKDKLFVAQNCAAMPENLLESELFGHKKGAFTGATDDKKGLFELADHGTLFLDEIGEMPLPLQAKLLRALQEGEIRPVGSNFTKRVDVRIVAATNRDLEKEVAEGRFRQDLFYRLKVFPIRVPPLRERREDIPALVQHFMKRYASEFGRVVGGVSQQAMEALQSYAWPGNVRELENEVQRLVIQLGNGEFVQPEDLSARVRPAEGTIPLRPTVVRGSLRDIMDHFERQVLVEALREHNNNKSATAKTLGITREGLHKKLRGFGMT